MCGSILRFNGQVSVFWAGYHRPGHGGRSDQAADRIGTPLLGRVLLFDALTMTWRELTLAPDPDAAEVTAIGEPTAEVGCQTAPPPASVTGRV
ncbi:hypothetical protein M3B11_04745 [Brevibacterium sp. p3-SID960]|uniref:hypothetical protein n=1 Tax=Brevibacterium sp. p3-SID960 TaxID=2916063 RepID=UPI0021A4AD74|nr:hypothetical protein [Brevibacterium sp. p3-SID960]MCT1690269.1 hypothetical protein [Brevibacterium sp. p3-SID960]